MRRPWWARFPHASANDVLLRKPFCVVAEELPLFSPPESLVKSGLLRYNFLNL